MKEMSEAKNEVKNEAKLVSTRRKVKIIPAKRKHRIEMDRLNRKNLPENYPLEFWEFIIKLDASFVLCDGINVVGYCLCNKDGDIYSFVIDEKYQGEGWGQQLLKVTIKAAKERKCKEVCLKSRVSNEKALHIYKKLGFEITETKKEYYDEIEGNREDAYQLKINSKKLNELYG